MYDNIEFTEDELNKLNIHELRDLSRTVGVMSPTTLSKSELVCQILNIIYGDDVQLETQSGAGRPVKNKNKQSKLVFSDNNDDNSIEINEENPFVKKYGNNPYDILSSSSEVKDEQLYNPYNNLKVASKIVEYGQDENKTSIEQIFKNSSNQQDSYSDEVKKSAEKIRKLLDRVDDFVDTEEECDDEDFEDLIYVSGFVFKGALNKFYFCSDNIEDDEQVYLIDDKLCELFAIREGDYIHAWVDPVIKAVQYLFSINGYIIP